MEQNPFVLYLGYWISELWQTAFRQDHPTLSVQCLHTIASPMRGKRNTQTYAHKYIFGLYYYVQKYTLLVI